MIKSRLVMQLFSGIIGSLMGPPLMGPPLMGPLCAQAPVCAKCEEIREYNKEHHENYEYYDDYLKCHPEESLGGEADLQAKSADSQK